jgi:mono/diheme cytochrome c family protein
MRLFATIGFLAVVAIVAAAVYFFGGFYNVAATQRDPRIVDWAIGLVRMASVDRHATQGPPIPLDNPNAIQAGARAYADRGCINCHGAPGFMWEKFSEGLRPDPPDLTKVVAEREPRQLFWVVANGIKATGMPSFALTGASDQELWAIVAFLKKLPTVTDTEFKSWVEGAAVGSVTPPG